MFPCRLQRMPSSTVVIFIEFSVMHWHFNPVLNASVMAARTAMRVCIFHSCQFRAPVWAYFLPSWAIWWCHLGQHPRTFSSVEVSYRWRVWLWHPFDTDIFCRVWSFRVILPNIFCGAQSLEVVLFFGDSFIFRFFFLFFRWPCTTLGSWMWVHLHLHHTPWMWVCPWRRVWKWCTQWLWERVSSVWRVIWITHVNPPVRIALFVGSFRVTISIEACMGGRDLWCIFLSIVSC